MDEKPKDSERLLEDGRKLREALMRMIDASRRLRERGEQIAAEALQLSDDIRRNRGERGEGDRAEQ
jgi:hypothetical protein